MSWSKKDQQIVEEMKSNIILFAHWERLENAKVGLMVTIFWWRECRNTATKSNKRPFPRPALLGFFQRGRRSLEVLNELTICRSGVELLRHISFLGSVPARSFL